MWDQDEEASGPFEVRLTWLTALQVSPAVLMGFGGLGCCLPAAMMNDSPDTKVGLLYYLVFFQMIGTSPIGILSAILTVRLARWQESGGWLWLNWLVFVAHFTSIYHLSTLMYER